MARTAVGSAWAIEASSVLVLRRVSFRDEHRDRLRGLSVARRSVRSERRHGAGIKENETVWRATPLAPRPPTRSKRPSPAVPRRSRRRCFTTSSCHSPATWRAPIRGIGSPTVFSPRARSARRSRGRARGDRRRRHSPDLHAGEDQERSRRAPCELREEAPRSPRARYGPLRRGGARCLHGG